MEHSTLTECTKENENGLLTSQEIQQSFSDPCKLFPLDSWRLMGERFAGDGRWRQWKLAKSTDSKGNWFHDQCHLIMPLRGMFLAIFTAPEDFLSCY